MSVFNNFILVNGHLCNRDNQENGILNTKKILKEYLRQYFDIIPQHFKFVDEFPLTDRGKTDGRKIEEI